MPISELSPNRGQLHVRAAKLLRLAAASFLAAQLVFFPVPSDAGDKPTSAPSTASRVSARVSTNDPVLKRSEEHTSELQSRLHLVCRLLLEKKKKHPVNVTNS